MSKCSDCAGTGKCSKCDGTGEDYSFSSAINSMGGDDLDDCSECSGTGRCQNCDGEGYIDDDDD